MVKYEMFVFCVIHQSMQTRKTIEVNKKETEVLYMDKIGFMYVYR